MVLAKYYNQINLLYISLYKGYKVSAIKSANIYCSFKLFNSKVNIILPIDGTSFL